MNSFAADPISSSFSTSSVSISEGAIPALEAQLLSEPPAKQVLTLQSLAQEAEPGLEAIMRFLSAATSSAPTIATGKAYQILYNQPSRQFQSFLATTFPQGLVPIASACGVDYAPLQHLLVTQDYEAADRLTLQKLCELAGTEAVRRKWIYFTEVDQFPGQDLRVLDQLWAIYSEGKFGFAKQREIWLSVGQNWELLWEKIEWRSGNAWTRYPGGFTWNLSAPNGHLPLTNQLRGVRVMASLMNHPVWQEA